MSIRKADYIAKYGEEAWAVESARRSKYNKRWNREHPDYKSQWNEEHPDYYKEYYEANKEQATKQTNERRKTQKGRAIYLKSNYNRKDKKMGLPTDKNVDEDWIIKNIFGSSCIYCGESDWRKLGADRIDNAKGHTPDNCVPCCWDCNNERGKKYSFEEFLKIKKGGA